MSFRTVAMYRCAWGHTKMREVVPGRANMPPPAPAPELPCDVCARTASQHEKKQRPPFDVKPLVFEGLRRVKNSALKMRG